MGLDSLLPAATLLPAPHRKGGGPNADRLRPPPPAPLTPLGASPLDDWLGGGLARAAVHEVFPAGGADQPAAAGFGLALLARAAAGRPIVWVRHDAMSAETGRPYGPGLADWGLDPDRVLFVRAASIEDVLRAAGEAARCGALGGVFAEAWGEDKRFDLTASRRLALRVERAGAPLILVRAGAVPAPSAAATRWRVRAAPSRPLPANAPGAPAVEVELLRRRGGAAGGPWRLEWSRDDVVFRLVDPADTLGPATAPPTPGAVVSFPGDGPRAAGGTRLRRAG